MKIGKTARLLLLLCCCLLLSGCRSRTTGIGAAVRAAQENTDGNVPEEQTGDLPAEGEGDGERTFEDPDATRKEYDEQARSELEPGTDRSIHGEGDGEGQPRDASDAARSVTKLKEDAEETATETVPADQAEQMGVSEEAEEADSALTYYTVLLQDRMGSLFECKRLTVYWETAEDHVTVYKTSTEHAMILESGSYDVSSRLLEENLRVDDGWVVRKDPGVIVKIVDSSVLGSGAVSTGAARSVRAELLAREGWSAIDAVRNGRVLLLSGELLQTTWGRVAAMVLMARTAMPELFTDVDPDTMLQQLAEEATGSLPAGCFYEDGQ